MEDHMQRPGINSVQGGKKASLRLEPVGEGGSLTCQMR